MHIKFVSTMVAAPWGGSEVLWSETAKKLFKQGATVTASVQGWPKTPPQVQELRKFGINIWERPFTSPNLGRRLWYKISPPEYSDPNFPRMKKWLMEGHPNLICFSDGAVLHLSHFRLLCVKLGLPYVNLAQLNAESFWPADQIAEDQALILEKAQKCFFVSRGNLELCEAQLGIRLPNAEVVRNPFGVEYDIKPDWPDDKEDGLSLACVARLEPMSKGQDLLLRVLAMAKWRTRALKIHFYGEGKMERSLRRLAGMLGVEKKAIFHGKTNDIQDIWKKHHALVLPSRHEGMPLVAVEAMLCHRPVFATSVGGIPEIVKHNETGFLTSACTVQAIDDLLENGWNNRKQLKLMGLKAGKAIHELVPPDPAKLFSEILLKIAYKANKHGQE